jgi:hypothetical protein
VTAERPRARQRLPIRAIIVAAARAGRHHAGRILIAAIVVSMAAALVETIAHEVVDRTSITLSILSDLSVSAVNLLGVIFLSGFLTQLVGEAEHGRPHAGIREILHSLAWGRLIRADLLAALLVAIGLIALLIPGLVALTLFAVVGPVIETERRSAVAALRRSARLARPHFWGVLLLVTLPLLIASAFPAVLPDAAGLPEVLAFLAIRGIGEAAVESVLGLILVELAYRLIDLDRSRGGPAPAGPVPGRR